MAEIIIEFAEKFGCTVDEIDWDNNKPLKYATETDIIVNGLKSDPCKMPQIVYAQVLMVILLLSFTNKGTQH